MAIDYGQKKIGLAGSQSGIIAEPLEIIDQKKMDYQIKNIFKIFHDYSPEKIIVGLPTNEDGTDSNWTKEVRKFIDKLKLEFGQDKIGVENEYLTSNEAKIRSGRKEGEPIDDYSALIILEQFLNSKS